MIDFFHCSDSLLKEGGQGGRVLFVVKYFKDDEKQKIRIDDLIKEFNNANMAFLGQDIDFNYRVWSDKATSVLGMIKHFCDLKSAPALEENAFGLPDHTCCSIM